MLLETDLTRTCTCTYTLTFTQMCGCVCLRTRNDAHTTLAKHCVVWLFLTRASAVLYMAILCSIDAHVFHIDAAHTAHNIHTALTIHSQAQDLFLQSASPMCCVVVLCALRALLRARCGNHRAHTHTQRSTTAGARVRHVAPESERVLECSVDTHWRNMPYKCGSGDDNSGGGFYVSCHRVHFIIRNIWFDATHIIEPRRVCRSCV